MNRVGSFKRETKETSVEVTWDLDGTGDADVSTGIGFLDHMVEQLARHGIFDITLKAKGDLKVDYHHTVEDVGIGLGRALLEALGDSKGIVRMGDALVPLDESLAQVALDLSGRGYATINVTWADARIGELPSDLIEHLIESIAREAKFTLHASVIEGINDHHKAECMMKALARALSIATRIDPRRAGQTPSTKETLR